MHFIDDGKALVKPVVLFQKLPRFLRRHKILVLFCRLAGGANYQQVRVNNQFDAYIDIRDGFARLVAIEPGFEEGFFELAQRLVPKQDAVFFDVGANFGLMSLGLSKLYGASLQGHLFEPNPSLCEVIAQSFKINPGSRLKLENTAVMASPGNVFLSFNVAHTGAGYVGNSSEGVPVRSITLDNYMEENRILHVDLLKIDVEGNEASVLEGAAHALAERRINAVYFEYCPSHLARSGCAADPISVLHRSGYDVFEFMLSESEATREPTHTLVTQGAPSSKSLLLRIVNGPVNTKITDLLALPSGCASIVN